MSDRLTVTAVAVATGYSAQQIRDLERLGVIATAVRADNGYRRFSAVHIRELRAYRDLAHAVGPVEARRAMASIRTLPTDRAAALVCSLHTGLNRERAQAIAAREALEAIHQEAATDADPVEADTMTITELARALGLRASTLRFWEQAGLIAPDRVATPAGSARRYALPAIRDARITTALRAAGYGITDVRTALTAIRDLHDVSHSLDALADRLDAISRRELALLRAGATLSEIIEPNGDR
ncbi:MerR family transcriptional regulator [Nocardia spumae]|uniref:MerR family transcriptional regulator n=1 Tax=Nocardia spumae TaxID=2887190 RepID=UPI001D136D4F|nr:MerR family transcriptional regulator [Nocardia spumae]